MASLKFRYYLIHDRIVQFRVERLPTRRRWQPTSVPSDAVLLVEITPRPDAKVVKLHNNCSREREIEAILMYEGKFDYDESTQLNLPESLISNVEDHVANSINRIVRRYASFSSEDMITAAFGDRIQEEFTSSDANIDITFQAYSSCVKEPINGADLSVIFDMKDRSGNRLIKTILIQSKKSNSAETSVSKLPRLQEQINKMNAVTEENYVALYHPDGFTVFRSSEPEERSSMNSLFGNVIRCNKGDKSKGVLASSLDSKHVIQFIVTE